MLIIARLEKFYHETQEGVLLVSEQLFDQFVEENARLREALQRACNSLGADMEDYL